MERRKLFKRTISGIMLIQFLVATFSLTLNIQPAKASGTVYIRANGSVDPETVPISSFDNITYTFIDNIYDQIVVERDNIVVDGAGYTLQGIGAGEIGVDLSGRRNVTIKNMKIEVFHWGVNLSNSSGNTITGNSILEYFEQGIRVVDSSLNTISGNNITNCYNSIRLFYSDYNVISANSITECAYGIILDHSSNNNVVGNNLVANDFSSIALWHSSNNVLRSNIMVNHTYNFGVFGIDLTHYMNDVDSSNTIDNKPIYYWINKRDMTVPFDAGYVALINCNNITVKNLNLNNNLQSVLLFRTENSTIIQNNIANNGFCSIQLHSSSNNTIFHNNFVELGPATLSRNSTNAWDNGYPSGGNYWCTPLPDGTYWCQFFIVDLFNGPNQDIPGKDDIADNPYHYYIGYQQQDNYPLSQPWSSTDTIEPTMHVLSPQNVTHKSASIPLTFTLYDTVHLSPISWIGYSLDGQANATITGNTTLTGVFNGTHSITVYANDTFGNMGSSDTVCFAVLLGDLNNDGKIDIRDIATAALAFGSCPGHPRWDPIADMNHDDKVDIRDIALIARNFGKTYP